MSAHCADDATVAHFKLIRCEYAFRSLGSGGPAMEASREVRKASEALLELMGRNTRDLFFALPDALNLRISHTPSEQASTTLLLDFMCIQLRA